MKQLLVLFFILACGQVAEAQSPVPASELKKTGWLEGTWVRTHLKPGRTGAETWSKHTANEWRGLGYTLQDKDTLFAEHMKLIIFDNTPAFVADVPENKGLVYFKFTAVTDHSFTCENPSHDYPKKIVYNQQGNTLKVTISGNGKSNEFLFEKED